MILVIKIINAKAKKKNKKNILYILKIWIFFFFRKNVKVRIIKKVYYK